MLRFRRFIFTSILIVFHGNLLSQNYFPVDPGSKWYYIFSNYNLVQVITAPNFEYYGRTYQAVIDVTPEVVVDSSQLEFEGKTYYVYTKEREDMAIDTLYVRKDTVGNVYFFDQHSNSESLYVPLSPKKGDTWKSADDRYVFKIKSLKGRLRSHSVRYKNCLVVSVQGLNMKITEKPLFHYFYNGIGQVGTKYGNRIIMRLVKYEAGNAR